MPAGLISLILYTDQSCVSLKPVTYYTSMTEVSRYLEKAASPLNFICQVWYFISSIVVLQLMQPVCSFIYLLKFQAFDLTSNVVQSLDTMLTDSLKSKMPATGLQLFGIKQIEEDNMSACEFCSPLYRSVSCTVKKKKTDLLLLHMYLGTRVNSNVCLFLFCSPYLAFSSFDMTRVKVPFRMTCSNLIGRVCVLLRFRSTERGASYFAPLCC